MKAFVLIFTLVAASFAGPLRSSAAAGPGEFGSRLGVDTSFFAFTRASYTDPSDDTVELKQKDLSLFGTNLGLSAGIVRGAFFGGGRVRVNFRGYDDGSTAVEWALAPYVEGMLNNDGAVRPFAQFGPEFGGRSLPDDAGDTISRRSRGFFTAFGIHAFAAGGFSIDPQLVIGWARHTIDDGSTIDTTSILTVSLAISVTGWFRRGGSNNEEAAIHEDQSAVNASPNRSGGPSLTTSELSVTVPDGRLSFSAAPAHDAATVSIEYVRLGETQRFTDCDRLTVEFNGRTGRVEGLRHQVNSYPGGVEESLSAPASPTILAILSGAQEATLDFCGERITPDTATQARIRAFYRDLMFEAAQAGHQWTDPDQFAAGAAPEPADAASPDGNEEASQAEPVEGDADADETASPSADD